ncbi:MAG: hypothetical protein ABR573_05680 [Candidatus Dormibacteria bacterium]
MEASGEPAVPIEGNDVPRLERRLEIVSLIAEQGPVLEAVARAGLSLLEVEAFPRGNLRLTLLFMATLLEEHDLAAAVDWMKVAEVLVDPSVSYRELRRAVTAAMAAMEERRVGN